MILEEWWPPVARKGRWIDLAIFNYQGFIEVSKIGHLKRSRT